MGLSSDSLRLDEARRIALAAQGFADPRPAGRVDRRHFRRVLDRVGPRPDRLGQRAHPSPTSCRSSPAWGPTTGTPWPGGSGAAARSSSTGATMASLLPVELHPLLRWRMAEGHAWTAVASWMQTHPDLGDALLEAVRERGPVTLGQLDHLGDAVKRSAGPPGQMWNWTPAKSAVEWFFWQGVGRGGPQPADLRAQLRHAGAGAARRRPRRADPDRRRRHEGAAAAERPGATASARPRTSPTTTASRSSRPVDWSPSWPPTARCGRWRSRGGGTPPSCTPRPSSPGGSGPSALLSPFDSLVWERDRTEAPVRVPLPHRDLRARRQAGARLLRAALPPRRAPRRPRRPQGRPAGRAPARAGQLRRTDLGRRPGPSGPARAARRSWPRFLGLDPTSWSSRAATWPSLTRADLA